ncbi:hypothetical protein SAMN04487846_2626 [Microbacterium sp. cf046]|uniref:hypothetical protein n=1 Tax=Microbacterium sp. cf046 TaxID=1761803 RepID=UPI0008F00623|nr:hypothetical protein [Microbacterium sp. cf046]SFS13187.1 hypothetical protein SAMN04487846_2626 [Microbacterium sp. cf046]
MPLIIVCVVLLALAMTAVVLWGGERLVAPESPASASGGRRHLEGLRYYLWWATVFVVIGTATGVFVTGAGGRLVMRLLAVTSPDATGRLTEAQAIVGDITPMGTLAYLIFGALPFAFASAALYLLVAPWLPRGRLGGPTFGVVLLVTVSPFIDPLRVDNIDFDRVGPGWLSVLLFSALAVLQGAALAALAARLSRSLPLMSRRNWPATGALLLPAVVLFPIGVVVAFGALVTAVFPRLLPWFLALVGFRGGVIVGRVLLIVAVLAALPAFVVAVVSIWNR